MRVVRWKNPSGSAVFETLISAHLAPATMATMSKSLKPPFYLILMLSLFRLKSFVIKNHSEILRLKLQTQKKATKILKGMA